MKKLEHPSRFVSPGLVDQIRRLAPEAEKIGRLHPDQLSIIMSQNWLNMFVPKEYGGLELPLPEAVRIEECLSWTDGSVGWVVTLCGGAAWFSGFLPRPLLGELFSGKNVCFAGSGAPTGTAIISEKGYHVRGYWKYASGSLHASIFTANCILMKKDKRLLNNDGTPIVRAFLFKKDEVTIHLNWNAMGMTATGSHDFEVKPTLLDRDRCFIIDPKMAVLKNSVYQFPFLQFAEVTIAVNLSGMAIRFMDLCETIFEDRIEIKSFTASQIRNLRQRLVKSRNDFMRSRQKFYGSLDSSWAICGNGRKIPSAKLGVLTKNSHRLAEISRRCVDELYPYCGLASANPETEINRVWRNLHTASQHALFTSI